MGNPLGYQKPNYFSVILPDNTIIFPSDILSFFLPMFIRCKHRFGFFYKSSVVIKQIISNDRYL